MRSILEEETEVRGKGAVVGDLGMTQARCGACPRP